MASISRSQKVRLGIFVAAGLFIFFGTFILLAGRALVEHRDEYRIHFSNKDLSLSGMEVGSEVKYSGIRIGRVEKIRLKEGDVSTLEVIVSVPSGTPIAEDSLAQVASAGITGMKYIELTRGSTQARVREPGETIPAGESLIDELTARAMTISVQLQELLDNLKLMTGPESSLQGIMKSSQGLIDENRDNVAGIVSDVRKITGELSELSARSASVVTHADDFMGQLNAAGSKVNVTLGEDGTLFKALAQTETLLQRVNLLVLRSENDLDITLRNLREASANLSDFSLAIRDNPSILINNPQPRGMVEGP